MRIRNHQGRNLVNHGIPALAVLSVCSLIACASRPTKFEWATGPAPYAFDCEANPNYYEDFHIHASNGKLTVNGVMQIVAVGEHPDPRTGSSAHVILSGETYQPFGGVGLTGFIRADSRDKIYFTLRWGVEPSQQLPPFAVSDIGDRPINFQLTLDESYQLTVSLSTAAATTEKSIFVPPFKVVRASLYCSGAHIRYSNVFVSAQ